MLLADADAGWVAAAVTGAVTIAGLLGGGVGYLLKWADQRHKTGMDEYREIVARQDAHIAELQIAQNDCREREARYGRVIVYLYGVVKAQGENIVSMGGKAAPMADLSDLLDDPSAAEFDARQKQQSTVLLHEEAKRVAAEGPKGLAPGGKP